MIKQELYENYHRENGMWGMGALHFKERLDLIIKEIQPKSILDYGCGKGKLVDYLGGKYPNIKVYGYDPYVEKYKLLTQRKFDFVICTDVLEHIPENELIDTVMKISSLSDKVFFILHHGPAETVLENGENAHCTIKPPEWYYDIFKRFFSCIYYLPAENGYNTACITFIISETAELKYYQLTEVAAKQEMYKLMFRNNLLRNLLKTDWNKFNKHDELVLYGFGYNCRVVYDLIKDKCKISCFVDSKKDGIYDGVPIVLLDSYRAKDNDIIVVFPEYDFEAIKHKLETVIQSNNKIYKASQYFSE